MGGAKRWAGLHLRRKILSYEFDGPILWLSGRLPGAVAWIGNTKGTVKPSKTSMSILWSAMLGSVYAAIPRGREPGDENAGHQ